MPSVDLENFPGMGGGVVIGADVDIFPGGRIFFFAGEGSFKA